MRIKAFFAVMAFLLLGAIGCSKTDEAAVYKIGALLPLTGNASAIGEYVKSGMDLAVEEINNRGGVKGKKIEIVYEDTKNDPKEGVSIFSRLLATHKIPVVVVAMTGVTNAVIPVADGSKTVVFATTASAAGITDRSPYAFRLFITADLDASTMAKFAAERLHLKRIAIVRVNDEFGASFSNIFKTNFVNNERAVIHEEAFEKGATDFRGLALKIRQAKPDGVYLLGYDNNLALLPLQLREVGVTVPLLSIGTLGQPNVVAQAGKALEGAYFTTTEFAADRPVVPEAKQFVEKYQAKYGKSPNYFSAFSYDAVGMLARAIEQGGYKADGIRTSLGAQQGYQGAMGKIDMKPNRDADFRMVVKQFKSGGAVDAN